MVGERGRSGDQEVVVRDWSRLGSDAVQGLGNMQRARMRGGAARSHPKECRGERMLNEGGGRDL